MRKFLATIFAILVLPLIMMAEALAVDPPKVGEIVYYTSLQGVEDDGSPSVQPAIVTRIRSADAQLALHIFYPSGTFVKDPVPHSETPKPGHWHLPPWEKFSPPKDDGGPPPL
jgi:hypothetical protein